MFESCSIEVLDERKTESWTDVKCDRVASLGDQDAAEAEVHLVDEIFLPTCHSLRNGLSDADASDELTKS